MLYQIQSQWHLYIQISREKSQTSLPLQRLQRLQRDIIALYVAKHINSKTTTTNITYLALSSTKSVWKPTTSSTIRWSPFRHNTNYTNLSSKSQSSASDSRRRLQRSNNTSIWSSDKTLWIYWITTPKIRWGHSSIYGALKYGYRGSILMQYSTGA